MRTGSVRLFRSSAAHFSNSGSKFFGSSMNGIGDAMGSWGLAAARAERASHLGAGAEVSATGAVDALRLTGLGRAAAGALALGSSGDAQPARHSAIVIRDRCAAILFCLTDVDP